ncbi:MAG TPA: hypothetical protein VG096_02830 [Bryobacteraceae bacterium]|jgi:hypothetical protein|nr:hypothetical protein [Bryobacteraceae bacterium]
MDNNHIVGMVSSKRPVRSLRYAALALLLVPGLVDSADRARTVAQVVAAAASQGQPTITVLPASSGASLQNYTPASASLSLGRASYYGGYLAPGLAVRRNSSSLVLSSRFGLQVACSRQSGSSLVEVTTSLVGIDPSYTVSMDSARLASAPVTVLRCGSVTEHVVEVEVPKAKPAGPIGGTLSFSARLKN